ncbi:Lnb N-terminal periplasmic domain-containing protein [Zhongshania marina]|uniref:Uncharacterized protein n=1 Tax=Zhongshania marina TaxID=2304603 RepID=A0A2S4HL66_9GAMM|nr:DUF4105 domain-containing protein [Marortus luteolus]POP54698.1 hypothetical protein C0068_00335 [Marortus luteolus]
MNSNLAFAIAFVLLWLPSFSLGTTAIPIETASENIFNDKTWLKLLHYQRHAGMTDEYKSTITSPQFFLSEKGRASPKDELLATLQAIYLPANDNPNLHAQCRFRARYLWLKDKYNLSSEPKIHCSDYLKFTSNEGIKSLSLVLATGYLGNPASYYGHLLIKLNTNADSSQNSLIEQSINYGAVLPRKIAPIPYVLKGLFGGFQGSFTNIQYYFHNHQYGENELRDLWEYELKLPQKDVKLISAHTWELLGINFQYFFINKNCAYQMADLLTLSDKVEIPALYSIYAIPQVLPQKLNELGLVQKVKYHPSRQSRFYSTYSKLSTKAKLFLKKSSANPDIPGSFTYSKLNADERRNLIDTTINYYQFLKLKNHNTTLPTAYYDALAASLNEPPVTADKEPRVKLGPESGRKPSSIRISAVSSSNNFDGIGINIRPAYYDTLDADAGHRQNGRLGMLEINARLTKDRLILNSFDLFSIESNVETETNLPGDGGLSWKLRGGSERQNFTCDNCSVARVQGDIGKSYKINSYHFINGYIGGAIHENKNGQGHSFVRASITDTLILNKFSARIAFEQRLHDNNQLKSEQSYAISARYQIDKNIEFRTEFRKNIAYESEIGFGWYW